MSLYLVGAATATCYSGGSYGRMDGWADEWMDDNELSNSAS